VSGWRLPPLDPKRAEKSSVVADGLLEQEQSRSGYGMRVKQQNPELKGSLAIAIAISLSAVR
jgi:hypothetical protein